MIGSCRNYSPADHSRRTLASFTGGGLSVLENLVACMGREWSVESPVLIGLCSYETPIVGVYFEEQGSGVGVDKEAFSCLMMIKWSISKGVFRVVEEGTHW